MFCVDTGRIITGKNIKFLLTILNSKFFFFAVKNFYGGGGLGTSGVRMKHTFFEKINVPKLSETEQDLQEVSGKFVRTIQRKFKQLENLPKKLERWHELSFTEFVKELKKKKIKLSLIEETEWEDFFLQMQEKALAIQTQITQTDKQIDQMVYKLYGLTEEEIKIIEN